MIKATMKLANGRRLLLLGLSRVNVKRIVDGDPIFVTLEDVGIPETDLTITFGETEAQIEQEIRDAGVTIRHYENLGKPS